MIEGAIRTGGVKGLSGELPGHVHYGTEGPPGGHYIPEVNQTGEKTAVITFTASKTDMPAVAPVEIELPAGPRGEKGADGNVAFDDLTEAQREMLRGPEGPAGTQGSPGQPGRDGIDGVDGVTPHIGSNGNWFIGNTDTGKPSRGAEGQAGQPGKDGQDYVLTPADKTEIANMAAGLVEVPEVSGGGYVVQDTAPEDTSVLWVDPTDNTEDAIPGSGGNVDLGVTGATVGQTVKISAVDENGVPTAWESVDFPDFYTKPEIDAIMGSYVTDIDTLVGGDS